MGNAVQKKRKIPASEKQIRFIWTLAGKLGWSRDETHHFCGAESLKQLSASQAGAILDSLAGLISGERKGRRKSNYRYTPEGRREEWERLRTILFLPARISPLYGRPVTRPHQNKIIYQVLKYFDDPEKASVWLANSFGYEKICNTEAAWKVTRALEEMLERKGHPAAEHIPAG